MILGIESTAHTFGIGIVKDGKVIANEKRSYVTSKGGIIPVEAAKHHRENKNEIYSSSLNKARIKEKDIDAIAFSQGPGLAPCLIEGINFAKSFAVKLKKPLIPVNHCIAHLEIGKITRATNPVMLYVSGANTQVIAYSSGKYRIFGETLDIGVGNFIDNFAREIGIGFPGGPEIQKLAEKGKNYIELPYKVKGMDIALSGILTNLKQKVEKNKFYLHPANQPPTAHPQVEKNSKSKLTQRVSSNHYQKSRANDNKRDNIHEKNQIDYTKEDLAYSMQETIFAMLVEIAERALAHTGKNELLLGGGVACNKRLQEMCRVMCEERNAKLFVPENALLVDNGAMIAFLGEIMFNSGIKFSYNELDKIDIKPRQRTDDVEVSWR